MGLLQSTAGAGDLTCWATNDSDPHSSPAPEWTSGVLTGVSLALQDSREPCHFPHHHKWVSSPCVHCGKYLTHTGTYGVETAVAMVS